MTLTITEPVALSPGCGCELGRFVPAPATFVGVDACCHLCGWPVHLAADIERHLDEGERVVWIDRTITNPKGDTWDSLVLAVFTESTEEED